MHSFSQSTLSQSRWTNQDIKEKLIPTVSIAVRGTSSWKIGMGLLAEISCPDPWHGIELLSEFDAFTALAHAPAVAIPQ